VVIYGQSPEKERSTMKVLVLQGSPRTKGNTEAVCGHMAEAMKKSGAKVEMMRLGALDVRGCAECFACQKVADRPACPQKDDMQAVYDKVLAADAVVLASPVFCWGMTAQLKAALDRFYAFCKFNVQEDGHYKCLIDGKKFALVVTAGGGGYDGAENCVASYRAMADFMRLENQGEFVVASAGEPSQVRADKATMKQAGVFARKIVQ
jgi:multimeric flavodoxin WrbA